MTGHEQGNGRGVDITRVVVPWVQLGVFILVAVWAGRLVEKVDNLDRRVANLEASVNAIQTDVRIMASK